MIKRIICLFLSCSFILITSAGCQKDQDDVHKPANKVLTIEYYDGKYGSKWIESIAKAYKSKRTNVTIKLKADSKIDQKSDAILETYQDVPDIMFVSNTNWEYWASKGYIENLSSLYNTAVDNNTTLLNKIKPDYLKHCELRGNYWIVPWDDGVAGFVYNKDLFAKNNWTVPATMQDFYTLISKIKAAGIIPIAWSGSSIGDWNYAIDTWWAQSEGRDGISNFLKMDLPEVYHQQGRLNALQTFSNIVYDKTNSIDGALEADDAKARSMFLGSKAAMMLSGSWFKCQAGNSIPSNFKLGFITFPAAEGAKEPNLNVAAAGGFSVIPIMSRNKDLAKDFLLFMSTDKMLQLYTSITSSPRPFNYKIANTDKLDDFDKDIINNWQSGNNIYFFSSNPLYYNVFSDWPESGAPFMQILLGKTTPQQAFDDNYNYVKENWDDAKKNF